MSALSFAGWPPAGTRSAEVRDVEVELERADLWVGLIQEDQPRWDISVGRVIRRQIEGALQGPVIEGHRQALADQRVGLVNQSEVQVGAGRIARVAQQPQDLAGRHLI